jgi:hypothetical protein
METLIFVHNRLSVTMLLFMLALGVWGLWNWLRGDGVTGSYQGGLAIGEGIIVVQAVIGVLLYLLGDNGPARGWLHILYGIAALISLPAAFAFTRGRTGRYEALIYAVVALFLAGLTTRAQSTGIG